MDHLSRRGIRCVYVYPHPAHGWDGKCKRFVGEAQAALGVKLCSVHDPKSRARTQAAHLARQARIRAQGRMPSPERVFRAQTIAAIKAVYVWWDEPGSPGREG